MVNACVKSRWCIRCPKCNVWATFIRHEDGWHYCMGCAARFSGMDVMGLLSS